jgi:membrane protein
LRHDYHEVEPAGGEPGQDTVEPSRIEKTRRWAAARREDAERLAERAQDERSRHRSVDAIFEMVDRDSEVGGGIIAGALAYRLFIWLLPLALVVVAGLGITADANSESPEQAATSVGMQGLISNSISSAADSPNRWYALLIGIPVLIWATRSVLRVLIGAHRLVWTDDRSRAPRPKLVATLRLLVLLLCFGAVSATASAVRAWSPTPGLVATLIALVAYAGIWLLVTLRLPHRDTDWTALIPGALVFGIGVEALHVVIVYFITPYSIAKQGTYGALGIAAGLLVGLFLVSRLVVAAAVANATLSERHARGGSVTPSAAGG